MALDFLILYEHTVREYESDLLLKLELERRGYTAEIRQLLDPKHLRLFGKDKPEVLVASCMYDNEAINSHVYLLKSLPPRGKPFSVLYPQTIPASTPAVHIAHPDGIRQKTACHRR